MFTICVSNECSSDWNCYVDRIKMLLMKRMNELREWRALCVGNSLSFNLCLFCRLELLCVIRRCCSFAGVHVERQSVLWELTLECLSKRSHIEESYVNGKDVWITLQPCQVNNSIWSTSYGAGQIGICLSNFLAFPALFQANLEVANWKIVCDVP